MALMSLNAGGEGSGLTRQRGPRGGDPTPEVSSHCPHRCPRPRFRAAGVGPSGERALFGERSGTIEASSFTVRVPFSRAVV